MIRENLFVLLAPLQLRSSCQAHCRNGRLSRQREQTELPWVPCRIQHENTTLDSDGNLLVSGIIEGTFQTRRTFKNIARVKKKISTYEFLPLRL